MLWDRAQREGEITPEVIREAEKVAGITFIPEEREQMLGEVRDHVESYEALQEVDVPNSVAPVLDFDPVLPGMEFEREDRSFRMRPQSVGSPPGCGGLAFVTPAYGGDVLTATNLNGHPARWCPAASSRRERR